MSAGEDLNCQTGYRDNYNYPNQVPTARRPGYPDADRHVHRQRPRRRRSPASSPPAWRSASSTRPRRCRGSTQARDRVPHGSWVNSDANDAVTETPARLALAREAGAKSIVLLKNTATLLPFEVPGTGAYKVAVIGFFANPPADNMYLGGYSTNQGPGRQGQDGQRLQRHQGRDPGDQPGRQVDFHGFTGTGTTAATDRGRPGGGRRGRRLRRGDRLRRAPTTAPPARTSTAPSSRCPAPRAR